MVFEVFRNSREMDKSLFWCLQPQYRSLIWKLDDCVLTQYVLSGNMMSAHDIADRTMDHLRYRLSCSSGWSDVHTARGRFQVELFIRYSNGILDELTRRGFQDNNLWYTFNRCCNGLVSRHGLDYDNRPPLHDSNADIQQREHSWIIVFRPGTEASFIQIETGLITRLPCCLKPSSMHLHRLIPCPHWGSTGILSSACS